jgi:hypothetical protein
LAGKRVTFLVIPENTSRVKQLKFSRAFMASLACIFLLALGGVGLIVHDYLA